MPAVVTGATGLVGNAVARALVARGQRVRAVVRDPERARKVLPNEVELVAGDLTDVSSLRAALRTGDVVFHAAGMPEQWARDERVFDRVNRQGTANLLEAALAAGVDRVVYTSTMDVFRTDAAGVLRETQLDPAPKHTAYERSKVAAEAEVGRALGRGLEVVLINPAAVYGPGPSNTGVTAFFTRLLRGKMPAVPPGGMSLTYVEALADAHLAAAERGRKGERYLVSDGYATTRELAHLIAQAAGLRRVPLAAPAWMLRAVAAGSAPLARLLGFTPLVSPSELTFLLWQAKVDAGKAIEELGYRPVPLEEGVRRTVQHLQGQRAG